MSSPTLEPIYAAWTVASDIPTLAYYHEYCAQQYHEFATHFRLVTRLEHHEAWSTPCAGCSQPLSKPHTRLIYPHQQ